MAPDRAARRRRVRRSAMRHGACSSRRLTCSVSCHVIASKFLCRSSSSALYPLDVVGTVRESSRFSWELCRPNALDQALARSGDIGSARDRPGSTPAATFGFGGAQKISNAASKIGISSFLLTKTDRSAPRKSGSLLMSITVSARVAAVSLRGPASRPASWSSRANAPSRGSRSGSSRTLCLLDECGHLLADSFEVLLVLQRRTERRVHE